MRKRTAKQAAPKAEAGEPRLYYPAGEMSEDAPECWGLIAWSKFASCYMVYFFDCEGHKVAAVPVEDREQVEWTKANLARFSSEWNAFNKWKEARQERIWAEHDQAAKAGRGRSASPVDPDSF